MLSNTLATKKSEKKEYELIPEGVYQVVLEDIKPVLNNTRKGQEERWMFQYVICDEGEQLGQKLFQRVNPVISNWNNNPSWLFSIIKALRNRAPDDVEMEEGMGGEEINSLIGKQAVVMVKHSEDKKGQTWANIDGIMAAKKDMPTPELKTSKPTDLPDPETRTAVDGVNAEIAGTDKDLPF